MKETPVQQRLRLRLSELGRVNWRNNSGACYDETGRLIRYGLGNDSAELNQRYKSSDLICINPMIITPDMVGRVVGQFMAIESKASDWRFTPGDKRAQAQLAWHDIVRQYGGLAGFATGPDDVDRIIRGG